MAISVLIVDDHSDFRGLARRLLERGVDRVGYLLKDRVAEVGELVDAIRRIAAGGSVIDPLVVSRVVGRRRERNPLDGLSEREREVLG